MIIIIIIIIITQRTIKDNNKVKDYVKALKKIAVNNIKVIKALKLKMH